VEAVGEEKAMIWERNWLRPDVVQVGIVNRESRDVIKLKPG
jgi:hypothetical protein